MQLRTPLGIWSTTFFTTLGLTPLTACGGATGDGAGSHSGSDAGVGTGGGAGAGGVAAGGAAPGGSGGVGGVTGSGNAAGRAAGGAITGGGGQPSTGGSGGNATGGRAAAGGAAGTPSPPCVNPMPRLDASGQPSGFVDCNGQVSHRTEKRNCVSTVPRLGVTCGAARPIDAGLPSGSCTKDTECTAHPYGYCQGYGGLALCACNYGCTRDEECGAGEICDCNGPVGECVAATCVTDADCGERLCLGNPESACGPTNFACRHVDDACTSSLDCPSGVCTLSGGVRSCMPWSPCTTGRPFLIAGAARVAALVERRDWSSPLAPCLEGLDRRTRAALAARWAEIALMEHASIAAFARFALELVGLGAPPELVTLAQAAMGEETAHARDAFGLAGAYAGQALGPGALDVDGALTARSPLDVVRTAILEGCIGETVAAVEAAEALAHATDPTVRQVLARVAADETRHAELAWRFVRWVLEHGEPELKSATERELAQVVRSECAAGRHERGVPAPDAAALLGHGVIDLATRVELRARVLAEVVTPCARAVSASVNAVRSAVPRPLTEWARGADNGI